MSLTQHPLRRYYRVVCSTGFILGVSPPPAPLEAFDRGGDTTITGINRRTPEQISIYREAAKKGWQKRKIRDGKAS